MTPGEELQATLDATARAVNEAGARMIGHGEAALRSERRASERRALAKAVRKLRRVIGTPGPATVTVTPLVDAPRVPRRVAVQPQQNGAP